jgi:orotate phosphoribosyltransferase
MNYVEGPALETGAKVAVVEDVVTSGASLQRAIDRIAAAGYQPVQALTIMDRQEGGRAAVESRGFALQAIFTRKDLNIKK